jgi:hypothetical protein
LVTRSLANYRWDKRLRQFHAAAYVAVDLMVVLGENSMKGGKIMKRIMTGSRIVLAVLIIGLMVSLPATIWAQAKQIEVEGLDDLLTYIWQEVTPLGESGRLLIDGQNQGNFEMWASDSDFDITGGTLILEYHINQDLNGNGTGHGPATILDGDGSTAWEGHWEGKWLDGSFECDAVTQGSGRFEGMTLKFHAIEIEPLVYSFVGTILVPHGE